MKSRQSVLMVSNRLPVQLSTDREKWSAKPSSGGLITALSGIKDDLDFRWVGWPGTAVPKADENFVRGLLKDSLGFSPLFLSEDEVDKFYNGFCNSVLWPLFHYLPGRVDFSLPYWDEYKLVNERFAELVSSQCDEGTSVWVHDYHLLLLPQMLRELRPDLKIGFFLHIPFPSSELFRLLPVRRELLRGILGSDLVGFHTHDYGRHFASSCLRILGAEPDPTTIRYEGRKILYGSYPIGINPQQFEDMLKNPKAQPHRHALNKQYAGVKVILGVDRIDYTKGLALKLKAYEAFLENVQMWRGKVVLIQVGIPSRLNVKEYQQVKSEVDELVGRINGRFGNAQYSPIQYIAHEVSFPELVALYERADVLLTTSTRDGMNLVSLEYVACQKNRHGTLVLSEFAGSAQALGGSFLINPWDKVQTAETLAKALDLKTAERKQRSLQNYKYVSTFSSLGWARRFLRNLSEGRHAEAVEATTLMKEFIPLKRAYQNAKKRLIFLDYDGTLTPHVDDPAAAEPSGQVLAILKAIGRDPKNEVFLISGRMKDDLERWFTNVHITLSAEHGLFVKKPNEKRWSQRVSFSRSWMATVKRILNDFSRRVPGTHMEVKDSALVWHYREADPEFGEWQALELTLHLDNVLSSLPVRVVQGNKVVEVRPLGIDKGTFVKEVLDRRTAPSPFLLCLGDDRTDEDMFAVLPEPAWTCRIGGARDTKARFFLEGPDEVLTLLEELGNLVEERPTKRPDTVTSVA